MSHDPQSQPNVPNGLSAGGNPPATNDLNGWIAFADRMPEPAYDPKSPKPKPTHGYILVTNNLEAKDRWGHMSHIWLVHSVHVRKRDEDEFEQFADGEITAFELRNLTHWRPAVPEEW